MAERSTPDLPGLPRDDDGPVFAAPWQAQAFAMTLKLHERGCFTWPEWANYLAREIEAAQARGEPDRGDTYYDHWLAALEKIVADRNIVPDTELERRRGEWERAVRATPHGQPILLERGRQKT